MYKRLVSFAVAILFNLICISLIASVVLFRADVITAQSGSTKVDDVALAPRSVEAAETDEDDDDDSGDADPPTADDGTDNDGYDTPAGEDDDVIVYTIRPGDTLWKLAARLGVPYAVLRAQDDSPSLIYPGQQFLYRLSDRIDSSIPPTDDDGTDSDGYDTPLPTTDFDGISTPPPTDNDGTDSDGVDTQAVGARGDSQAIQQQTREQNDPHTDNDGTDSDGFDTTGNYTDNDGTDSDGVDTTGNMTDNDGTDSDGYDTTGNVTDIDDTDDQDDTDDTGVSS
ncbi:MAG: LysM domain-containing protein [Chloroflexota bacterium]|nr:LysM domain-containing protein [Chloroflexota bacterium]MDE2908374.1 LysM domain-containing protein [Chloroflexota bacterium]